MHDKLFAQQIKRVAIAKLNELDERTKLTAINVKLSPFSHVKPETLKRAFELECGSSELENISLNVTMSEIEAECRYCGAVFCVSTPDVSCPQCKRNEFQIRMTPEFFVESVEVHKSS